MCESDPHPPNRFSIAHVGGGSRERAGAPTRDSARNGHTPANLRFHDFDVEAARRLFRGPVEADAHRLSATLVKGHV